MIYMQQKRRITLSFEEVIPENPSEETGIMVVIPIKDHKQGFSLELLNELILSATSKMKSYRIHHDPAGLVITGKV